MTAIVFFLGELHKHAAFDPEKVLQKSDINFPIFEKISYLLQADVRDTSTHICFLNLLTELKIDGVKSVGFSSDFTENFKILYQCNFPEELIPEEYLCLLSSQIMDIPCFDKRDPNKIFDKEKINKHITQKKENPYTRQKMSIEDTGINAELQANIENFIAKVILIYINFPHSYNDEYRKHKKEICGSLLEEEFKKQIEQEIYTKKTSTIDQISVKTLIDQKQKKNPLALYQTAVQCYKDKNTSAALRNFTEALNIFADIKGKDSEECFKCYSSLISCNRDLKFYSNAIYYAETAIDNCYNKITLDSVIKKYNECLKLQGAKLKDIYNQAIKNYKNKKYSLALYKLLFAAEGFNLNSEKAELASCHSTLASCYRELGLYESAITHCEQALELRKTYLKGEDKLIQDIEKKLSGLHELLPNKEKSTMKFT